MAGWSEPVVVGEHLRQRRRVEREGVVVKLEGTIDETLDEAKLIEGLSGFVVFDLDLVPRISSGGVRSWIAALERLSVKGTYFVRCRPLLVWQFNTVENFGVSGVLVSFYAPYLCTGCHAEVPLLLDLRRQYAEVAAFRPPPVTCPSCRRPARFDDVQESYFQAAAEAPPPYLPPAAEALIDGSSAENRPLRVTKELMPSFIVLWIKGHLDERARLEGPTGGLEGDVVAVLSGVSSASPEGIRGFLGFARACSFRLHLASVPDSFATTLAEDGAESVSLVSIRMPFRCTACDRETLEDFGAKTTLEPPCAQCGAPTTAAVAAETLAALQRLRFRAPPADIATYLASSRGGEVAEPGPASPSSEIVFGRYELVRQLGEGGMAEVFLARQLGPVGFQRFVAIKRLLPRYARNDTIVELFLNEARVAARLVHPNLVQLYDFGKMGRYFYIVMEYVQGWDLSKILAVARRQRVAVPVEIACRLGTDLCAGLSAAHGHRDDSGQRAPIVHLDVSPGNVLVSSAGLAKLSDFGVAKSASAPTPGRTGAFRGKIGYAAPERLTSDEAQPRLDVFSAGATVWECLAGRPLFSRRDDVSTLLALLEEPVPPLASIRQDVPPELDALLGPALSRDPPKRYADGAVFHDVLEKFVQKSGLTSSTAHVGEWVTALMGTHAAQLEATSEEVTRTMTIPRKD